MASAALLPTGKIQARHRERQAIVYVRQSTMRQVLQHQESTRLQYALSDRARQLGWSQDQVVVIDDDLGRSAASTLHRPGFQRLVAEVGLGHVGLVLGIEVSRLARSCRDWHQLLEMCALFDTLIADADGVYDAANFNDRMLLGLKGTMSEAELHILKARMHEGRRAKASSAAWVIGLPRGFVLRPSGEVALDPDEQVRATIQLVFDVFERRRSVYGVLRYLVDHDIQLPDRVRGGPDKGEVRWNRPNQATISDMLRHPAYAGAYVYGRRRMERRCQLPDKPHSGRRFIRAPERCCAKIAGPPTSTGRPTRAIRSRWRQTVASITASRAADRLCSAASSAAANVAGGCRLATTTMATRRVICAGNWRQPSADRAASRSVPSRWMSLLPI